MSQVCTLPRPCLESVETYLHDISETDLLNAEEERELAYQVFAGDPKARDSMIRANLRLVVNVARRYANRGLEMADLIAEGNLGLMRAVESFDPALGTRFSTYAVYWIKQSITRAFVTTGHTVRIPANMNKLLARWRRAMRQLRCELDRPPADEEVADRLGLSRTKMRVVRLALQVQNAAPPVGREEQLVPAIEVVPDNRGGAAEARLVNAERAVRVLALVERMGERRARVLRLRFGLDGQAPLTLKEVGGQLGLTRERVRQIEKGTLERLAKALQEV